MVHTSSIEVQIEISPSYPDVKFEIEKTTGRIFVDRFLKTAMHYPCHYGKIPETLAGDGDELDVLVITPSPLPVGCYIKCRPIGALNMIDEQGEDPKIIALPVNEVTPAYQCIQSITDLKRQDRGFLDKLRHFFTHYKDLDDGKWVQVQPGWQDQQTAEKLIEEAISAYHKK